MIETITTSLKRVVKTKITDGPHTTPQLVDDGIPFISAEGVVEGKIDFSKKRGYIKRKDHNIFAQKLLPQYGDIFFVKSGSTTGKIAFVETKEEFNVWSPLALIRVNDLVDNKLLFYILQSPSFQLQVRQYWSFGTQPNIGMNKIEQLKVTFPKSKEIQKEIVKYLDELFEKTNRFIQTKQRFIELLKEQRQSIIDEILNPEQNGWHWLRLKNVVTVNDETIGEETDDNFILKYIDIGNVNSIGQIQALQEMFFKNAPSRARRIVRNGDVIISTVRTYLKAITLISSDDKNLIASTGFAVLRAKSNIISEFLNNLIHTSYFINSVTSNSYGVSYPAITATSLARLKISIPSTIEEQKQIVEHIKSETKTLDIAISKAEREIELIKEYREAMIAEAVTGKMKL